MVSITEQKIMAPLSHVFCTSPELSRITFHRPRSGLSFREQHFKRSLDPPGGILFDDAIIGALIDSATEITLIDPVRLPLCLNLFFQL